MFNGCSYLRLQDNGATIGLCVFLFLLLKLPIGFYLACGPWLALPFFWHFFELGITTDFIPIALALSLGSQALFLVCPALLSAASGPTQEKRPALFLGSQEKRQASFLARPALFPAPAGPAQEKRPALSLCNQAKRQASFLARPALFRLSSGGMLCRLLLSMPGNVGFIFFVASLAFYLHVTLCPGNLRPSNHPC